MPLVPRQQPVDHPTPAPDDLARRQDYRVHKPLELHPQQPAASACGAPPGAAGARAPTTRTTPSGSEEVGGLLSPHLDPGPIEDVLEGLDVVAGEAAAEIAGGGGVGDTNDAEGVEEDGVVVAQLNVVEAGAVAQGVGGEVEDVVTLVVGEWTLSRWSRLSRAPARSSLRTGSGMAPMPPQEIVRALAGTSLWMFEAVRTGRGEGAVTGRSSRWRIFRLPAAWCGSGIGLTRDLLVVSVIGSV